jgi:hypothetical protein
LLIALLPIAADVVNSIVFSIFSTNTKMGLHQGKSGKEKNVANMKHDRLTFSLFYEVHPESMTQNLTYTLLRRNRG